MPDYRVDILKRKHHFASIMDSLLPVGPMDYSDGKISLVSHVVCDILALLFKLAVLQNDRDFYYLHERSIALLNFLDQIMTPSLHTIYE